MVLKENLEKLQASLLFRFPRNTFKVEYGPDKISKLDTIIITIDRFTKESEKKLMSQYLAKELKANYRTIKRVVYRKNV